MTRQRWASSLFAPAGTDTDSRGPRFQFGKNWQQYADVIDERRVEEAKTSLRDMLGLDDLHGKSFLDVGSGSGLFSLAARQLGAEVRSFDVDPDSVRCTQQLRERYGYGADPNWIVEKGSVLDPNYIQSLGRRFDIVYSWGVLHHTGSLWKACEAVADLVHEGGLLFVAIYNDQGRPSRGWWWVKYTYNRSPLPLRLVLLLGCYLWMHQVKRIPLLLASLLRGRWPERPPAPERGMSAWYDLVDWVGGYPFEVARPGDVFDFFSSRGYCLKRLVTRSGHGNNQFVLQRSLREPSSEGEAPSSERQAG